MRIIAALANSKLLHKGQGIMHNNVESEIYSTHMYK